MVNGHIDCHVISDLLYLLYVSFFYLPWRGFLDRPSLFSVLPGDDYMGNGRAARSRGQIRDHAFAKGTEFAKEIPV